MTRLFKPPACIRNPHVQTTLTSFRPRKYLARQRAAIIKENEQEIILDCGNDVRLLGYLNQIANSTKGIVTLIHGWEGSSDSSYILSAATALYTAGFSVFRLNLRDHGDSHHLNREPFNSSRLGEVLTAVISVNKICPHNKSFLAGFSLGGNFAIRIALQIPTTDLKLTKVVAISPLINPLTTTENMEKNHKIYHHYFIKKWKKSLRKKMEIYPEMDDKSVLLQLNTLREMHDYFVPRHTGSSTTPEYFATYRLQPENLKSLKTVTHIINAKDDPITRFSELQDIATANIPNLTVDTVPYGGHCGFIQDMRLTSWVDKQLVEIFSKS